MAFKAKKKELPEIPITDKVAKKIVEQPVETQESENVWSVSEIVTERAPIIYNNQTNEQLDLMEAMVRILNLLEEFKDEE